MRMHTYLQGLSIFMLWGILQTLTHAHPDTMWRDLTWWWLVGGALLTFVTTLVRFTKSKVAKVVGMRPAPGEGVTYPGSSEGIPWAKPFKPAPPAKES